MHNRSWGSTTRGCGRHNMWVVAHVMPGWGTLTTGDGATQRQARDAHTKRVGVCTTEVATCPTEVGAAQHYRLSLAQQKGCGTFNERLGHAYHRDGAAQQEVWSAQQRLWPAQQRLEQHNKRLERPQFAL